MSSKFPQILLLVASVYGITEYRKFTECPVAFQKVGGRCYFYGYFKLNWWRAAEFCHSFGLGASLATIESKRENDYIEDFLLTHGDPNTGVWLGGSENGHHGVWAWFPTGSLVEWTNWGIGQPTGRDQHCMYMVGGHLGYQWADFHCGFQMTFLCEYENNVYTPWDLNQLPDQKLTTTADLLSSGLLQNSSKPAAASDSFTTASDSSGNGNGEQKYGSTLLSSGLIPTLITPSDITLWSHLVNVTLPLRRSGTLPNQSSKTVQSTKHSGNRPQMHLKKQNVQVDMASDNKKINVIAKNEKSVVLDMSGKKFNRRNSWKMDSTEMEDYKEAEEDTRIDAKTERKHSSILNYLKNIIKIPESRHIPRYIQ